jgi:hypothetical protein
MLGDWWLPEAFEIIALSTEGKSSCPADCAVAAHTGLGRKLDIVFHLNLAAAGREDVDYYSSQLSWERLSKRIAYLKAAHAAGKCDSDYYYLC